MGCTHRLLHRLHICAYIVRAWCIHCTFLAMSGLEPTRCAIAVCPSLLYITSVAIPDLALILGAFADGS